MTRIHEPKVVGARSWPRLLLLAPVLAFLASAWGCAERISATQGQPGSVPRFDLASSDMHFLRTRTGAPPLAELSASFYAKLGEDRGVAIYYHAEPGALDSVKFLDFRVPPGALMTSPDGRAYMPGDSVLISVTITDPDHMILQFQPSGLKFSPQSPAALQLSFLQADNDLNGDGVVDAQDSALKAQLSIWVQESAGGLWTQLSSTLALDLEELTVGIGGFSGYAAAY
jgi:hypothetical protein